MRPIWPKGDYVVNKLLQNEQVGGHDEGNNLPRSIVQLIVWLTKYAVFHHGTDMPEESGKLLVDMEDSRVQAAFEAVGSSFQASIQDRDKIINSQGRMLTKLEKVNGLDEVTGLPPWNQGRVVLSEAIINESRRNGFAVLFTDLFGFKPVNDDLGHQMGNRVLRRVAEILRGYTREYDYITRFGGDENLIILKELESVDEAMAKTIELFWRVPDHDWHTVVEGIKPGYRLGHDIGLVYCINPTKDVRSHNEQHNLSSEIADKVVAEADANMYKAKNAHKEGRLEIWSSMAQFGYGSVRFYGRNATTVVR
jgi:GGDEF domain-containing protein